MVKFSIKFIFYIIIITIIIMIMIIKAFVTIDRLAHLH